MRCTCCNQFMFFAFLRPGKHSHRRCWKVFMATMKKQTQTAGIIEHFEKGEETSHGLER